MKTSIVLLFIAVLVIGIFALPSTVALFSGQHSWYDLSESIDGASGRNNVPCEKCHGDISAEMTHSDNGAHRDFTCAMCHRAYFTGYTYARGHYYIGTPEYPPTPGQEAHAASTVECMDCHAAYDLPMMNPPHTLDREYGGRCGHCHQGGYSPGFIAAGGFNLTPYAADTGTKAAHKKFVNDSINESLMDGANEACIACHTRIGVNISWTKSTTLNFNASENQDGVWSIDGFTAEGSNVTVSTYRNNWTNSY